MCLLYYFTVVYFHTKHIINALFKIDFRKNTIIITVKWLKQKEKRSSLRSVILEQTDCGVYNFEMNVFFLKCLSEIKEVYLLWSHYGASDRTVTRQFAESNLEQDRWQQCPLPIQRLWRARKPNINCCLPDELEMCLIGFVWPDNDTG